MRATRCRWGRTGLRGTLTVSAVLAVLAFSAACNEQRKQECDRFLGAMKPLDEGTPSAEVVDSVAKQVEGLHLQDDTLSIYAKNYLATLAVLTGTLPLKGDPNAPDGTDDVIKTNLKKARTDASDVARFCAQ
jgi:hypothetical protein